MEPISAIALSLAVGAGAIAGKEAVSAVVKDAYTALKDLIKSRYPKVSIGQPGKGRLIAAMSTIGVEFSDVRAQTIIIRDVNVGPTAEELVAALEAKGLLVASEVAGLQRRTIISLAESLKPDVLDFEQAVA